MVSMVSVIVDRWIGVETLFFVLFTQEFFAIALYGMDGVHLHFKGQHDLEFSIIHLLF